MKAKGEKSRFHQVLQLFWAVLYRNVK